MPNPWRIFAQKTNQIEKTYTPKVAKIIRHFRNEFIQDLKQNGQNVAVGNLQKQLPHESLTILIQQIYKRAGLMGARLTYAETTALAKVEQKAAGFGRNERWIRDVLNSLAEHMLKFVQSITETMRGDILKTLQKGADEGWSIDQIVTELKSSGLIAKRARVIARTEIIRAANVGHSVAASDLPYEVDKKWSAASDHRTRHSHRDVHNHQVGEQDFFKVPVYEGDKPTFHVDEMLYPGDATASPSNTINCRCRVLYIPKRDAQGRLIMRNPNQATGRPNRRRAEGERHHRRREIVH